MGKISIFLTLLVFFLHSTSYGFDRRSEKGKLTIMTLNVGYMWDGLESEEPRVRFPWEHNLMKAEVHMKDIAQIIIQNNPDIVNLVGIENEAALRKLNTKFLNGMEYRTFFPQSTDYYPGRDVGLLSKISPENDMIFHDARQGNSASRNYVATFNIDSEKITLIGIHLSFDTENAQAEAIKNIALEKLQQGYHVIILGDFNDYDGDSKSFDYDNTNPKAQVLNIIKRGGMQDGMFNVVQKISQDHRYTVFFDRNGNGQIDNSGELCSTDHILVSSELFDSITSVTIDHSYDPRSIYFTDHFPIIITLQTSLLHPKPSVKVPPPYYDESAVVIACIYNNTNTTISFDYRWGLTDQWNKLSLEPKKNCPIIHELGQQAIERRDYNHPGLFVRFFDLRDGTNRFITRPLHPYIASGKDCSSGKEYEFNVAYELVEKW